MKSVCWWGFGGITLLFFVACGKVPKSENTSVYNGGGTDRSFLEKARVGLVRTLKFISERGPEKIDLLGFCHSAKMLDKKQGALCEEFIWAVAQPIIELNQPGDLVPLVPWDGKERPDHGYFIGTSVLNTFEHLDLAYTSVGPEGPVYVDLSKLRYHLQSAIAVIFHEFGHKVRFREDYVADTRSFPHFNSARELLETAGQAVASVAIHYGFISGYSLFLDEFECRFQDRSFSFGASIREVRRPLLGGKPNAYTSGFGYSGYFPKSFFISMENGDKLSLRLLIYEHFGCHLESSPYNRWTRLELIEEGKEGHPLNVANVAYFWGTNPICQTSSKKRTSEWLPIYYERKDLSFECRFRWTPPYEPGMEFKQFKERSEVRTWVDYSAQTSGTYVKPFFSVFSPKDELKNSGVPTLRIE